MPCPSFGPGTLSWLIFGCNYKNTSKQLPVLVSLLSSSPLCLKLCTLIAWPCFAQCASSTGAESPAASHGMQVSGEQLNPTGKKRWAKKRQKMCMCKVKRQSCLHRQHPSASDCRGTCALDYSLKAGTELRGSHCHMNTRLCSAVTSGRWRHLQAFPIQAPSPSPTQQTQLCHFWSLAHGRWEQSRSRVLGEHHPYYKLGAFQKSIQITFFPFFKIQNRGINKQVCMVDALTPSTPLVPGALGRCREASSQVPFPREEHPRCQSLGRSILGADPQRGRI